MQDLISTPVIFPYVKPINWDVWWDIWFKERRILRKVVKNHNSSGVLWNGIDIYVKPGVDSVSETGYSSINLNCAELFPCIFENLNQLPIEVNIVRAVSSLSRVLPHTDTLSESISVRSMLYDNNIKDTFYYNINNKIRYQKLPTDTNTWAYWDNTVAHGTDYYAGHSKILIMYFGKIKRPSIDSILSDSQKHYSDYVIYNNSISS